MMELSVRGEEGIWRLSGMRPALLHALRQAAIDATADSEAARERLLPKPVSETDAATEAELVQDWREIVSPELEQQFATDVGTMMSDLDAVENEPRPDDAAEPLFSLDVPAAHAEAWFSALNQARLMLDLRHRLHSTEVLADFARLEKTGEFRDQAEADRLGEALLARARYEFFAGIQSWLLKHVMAIG